MSLERQVSGKTVSDVDDGSLRPDVFHDVLLEHFEARQLAMVAIAKGSRKSVNSEVGKEIAQEANGALAKLWRKVMGRFHVAAPAPVIVRPVAGIPEIVAQPIASWRRGNLQ